MNLLTVKKLWQSSISFVFHVVVIINLKEMYLIFDNDKFTMSDIFLKKFLRKYVFKMNVVLYICMFFCACVVKDKKIYHNVSFQKINEFANKENKVFCIVLYNDSSFICEEYKKYLNNQYDYLKGNAIFNFIGSCSLDRKWIEQWVCTERYPITLVFSPDGNLRTVLTGATKRCFYYMGLAINDEESYVDYIYDNPFMEMNNETVIRNLNKTLECKIQFENGENINEKITESMSIFQYPYNFYLKILNEQKFGNQDEAICLAGQFLDTCASSYFDIYEDIYLKVRLIVDPNLNIEEEPNLVLIKDQILLNECEIGKERVFQIALINKGKKKLVIQDIHSCCSCIGLVKGYQSVINSGEKTLVDFKFKADTYGKITKHITVVSNGIKPVRNIEIVANVRSLVEEGL